MRYLRDGWWCVCEWGGLYAKFPVGSFVVVVVRSSVECEEFYDIMVGYDRSAVYDTYWKKFFLEMFWG